MSKLLVSLFIIGELLFSRGVFATQISETQDLNPQVLNLALTAYHSAINEGIKVKRPVITIIDYSLPSSAKRLWVLNVEKQKVLFHTLVAHGKNSGNLSATSFSNQSGSDKTSIGLFLTENTYIGHNGYSLVLDGLEKGFNNNAARRSIVMHGAWYVNKQIIQQEGRIGRSYGCPAINKKLVKPVINTIKNGTLIFAYYPNQKWLQQSTFLHG